MRGIQLLSAGFPVYPHKSSLSHIVAGTLVSFPTTLIPSTLHTPYLEISSNVMLANNTFRAVDSHLSHPFMGHYILTPHYTNSAGNTIDGQQHTLRAFSQSSYFLPSSLLHNSLTYTLHSFTASFRYDISVPVLTSPPIMWPATYTTASTSHAAMLHIEINQILPLLSPPQPTSVSRGASFAFMPYESVYVTPSTPTQPPVRDIWDRFSPNRVVTTSSQ
jgi:hypothetical protein